ncbi:MAG TPA: nitroreductase family protein [Phycisphaerae bacterium]|nr:nitroreductase family protein [Phycisphaerae bacterium]
MSAITIPAVKEPQTVEGVLEPIRHRWSPRSFLDKPVPREVLRTLLEAARWSASSFNEQPCRFLVATRDNAADFEKMLSVLMPKNQEWAKAAPVLMLTVGRKAFSHNNTPNRYMLHDAGAALATLAIQAAGMGLQAHGMGGFDHDKARTVLKIPHDFELGAAVAVGYPGPVEGVPEAFRAAEAAPRTRRPLAETAFGATFGEPLAL